MSETPKGLPEHLKDAEVQFRTVAIDREALTTREAGDERIPVCLSSEAPVERWFGREILEHSSGAVDMTYAREGLPFLMDHDATDQIGIIEELSIDGDRKLRGLVRFSKSARAQEMRQDILDGIRKNISVGYRITDLVLEESSKDTGDTYRAKRWMPMEGSLVPIPADISVGVGRSAAKPSAPDTAAAPVEVADTKAPKAETKEERSMSDTPAAPAGVTEVRDNRAEMFTRLAEIAESYGAADKLAGWVKGSTTPENALRELVAEKREKLTPTGNPNPLDISSKELKVFSVGRALKAKFTGDYSQAGYEREVSESFAKRLGHDAQGILIPTVYPVAGVRTNLTAGGSTTGSKVVYTDAGPFIELLRNRAVMMRAGLRMLSGLKGNLALPRQATGGSASMVAENPGSDFTQTNMTFDQVTWSPKTITQTEGYTKQLFAQSVEAIDSLVTDDIFKGLTLKLDSQIIHGTGTNNITGIYNLSGVNSVAMGGAPTFAKLVSMETAIEADNADLGSMAYVTSPEVKGTAKTTQKFSSTTGEALWTGGIDGQVNGYAAFATNQVTKTLGAGTNEHEIIFAAFDQGIVADWGAIDLTIDNYTGAKQGLVYVTGLYLADFNTRHVDSFCIGTGLIP